MTDYISNNLTTIILAIVALFAVGIAIAIRIVVRKSGSIPTLSINPTTSLAAIKPGGT